MGIIKAAKLAFDYLRYEEEGEEPEVNRAIDHVDLDIHVQVGKRVDDAVMRQGLLLEFFFNTSSIVERYT